MDDYKGQDKIRGRPLNLNVQNLEPRKGKDYAEIILMGDTHYGSSYCDVERVKSMLDYCLTKEVYLFCMGDWLESATRYSVGSGVYEQLNPQKQMEDVIEMLRPLAEKNLILGYLSGNHEARITKETGIDVSKVICNILKVPYLGYAGWNLFRIGKQSYTMYALHGSTGARYKYSKMKAIIDSSHYFTAEIIAMGHIHDIIIDSVERQQVNKSNRTVEYHKQFVVVTGHYHCYGGYVKEKAYPPSKMGSPKVKLFVNKHDVHISV